MRLEAVNSSQHIHKNNTTIEARDTGTVHNGDITITEEEELNLFPSLVPRQQRQQSIKSSKSLRLPPTSKKFGKPKRPPVGSLGKLVTINKMLQLYHYWLF